MKIKIISDGTTKGTKVVDANTGEFIDNVSAFIITADAKDGLVRAILNIFNVELQITAIEVENTVENDALKLSPAKELLPIKLDIPPTRIEYPENLKNLVTKRRGRKPKFENSSDYTRKKLDASKTNTPSGEGYKDLEDAENGMNPSNKLDWRIWKYLEMQFIEFNQKTIKFNTKDIEDWLTKKYPTEQTGAEFKFDRTTINHTINRYAGLGVLIKKKRRKICYYQFDPYIRKKGLDWFRTDNKFMKGHFQKERGLGVMED